MAFDLTLHLNFKFFAVSTSFMCCVRIECVTMRNHRHEQLNCFVRFLGHQIIQFVIDISCSFRMHTLQTRVYIVPYTLNCYSLCHSFWWNGIPFHLCHFDGNFSFFHSPFHSTLLMQYIWRKKTILQISNWYTNQLWLTTWWSDATFHYDQMDT